MMNSWQEWVVALLLLLCAVRIGMSIYSFFHRVKENGNPCDSCASGCELKDMMEKKQKECSSKKKEYKEKIVADSLVVSKFVLPLQPQTRNNGSLDEWLSQRSAKPCTAVRICQVPRRIKLRNCFLKVFRSFLL